MILTNSSYQCLKPLGSTQKTWLLQRLSDHLVCVGQLWWQKDQQAFWEFTQQLSSLRNYPPIPRLIEGVWQDGRGYLIQTLIEGETLGHLCKQKGILTSETVIKILAQSLAILDLIHRRQLIHGEIKLDNLIYQGDNLFLVDFSSAYSLNHSITPYGSPEYAAPEQLEGKGNCSSDLYSLGIVCLQLLTGLTPFEILDNLAIPSISPSWLGEFLARMIALQPEERWPSASEAIQILQQYGVKFPKLLPMAPPCLESKQAFLGNSGLFTGINTLQFSPDGTILAFGSDEQTIRFWNWQSQREIICLDGNLGPIKSLAFAPDSILLASGNLAGEILIWHWQQQQLNLRFQAHTQAVTVISWWDSEKLLSASADKTIKLWNVSTQEQLQVFSGHQLGITALSIHPNLSLLATASLDRTVKLWCLDSPRAIQTLKGHTWPVRSVCFHPEGNLLASAGDDNLIFLWDWQREQMIRTISGHGWVVTAVAFSADGQILISGSWDKTIRLWEVSTGKLLATLLGNTDSITTMAINPCQQAIATGSQDSMIRLWRLENLLLLN